MAWSLPEGGVLGIFGKRPEPGRVKTRLAAASRPGDASRCTRRCSSTCSTSGIRRACRPGRPAGAASMPPAMPAPGSTSGCPPRSPSSPSRTGTSATGWPRSSTGEFEDGATRVVVIGSDCADPRPVVRHRARSSPSRARRRARARDDGGYYLVGCRRRRPADLRRDRLEHPRRPLPDDRPARRHAAYGLGAPPLVRRRHAREPGGCSAATSAPCVARGWTRCCTGPRPGSNDIRALGSPRLSRKADQGAGFEGSPPWAREPVHRPWSRVDLRGGGSTFCCGRPPWFPPPPPGGAIRSRKTAINASRSIESLPSLSACRTKLAAATPASSEVSLPSWSASAPSRMRPANRVVCPAPPPPPPRGPPPPPPLRRGSPPAARGLRLRGLCLFGGGDRRLHGHLDVYARDDHAGEDCDDSQADQGGRFVLDVKPTAQCEVDSAQDEREH